MTSSFSKHTFTPAEIDAIAGLSTGMQSEWRRRKVLPPKSERSWTRANLDVVTWIFVIKRLADAGYPLKEAQEAARAALPYVKVAIAQLHDEASREAREAVSKWSSVDDSKWAGDVHLSHKFSAATAVHPRRYLIFSRPADRADGAPVDVIALDDLTAVPDNLVVWTAMDNRRAAAAILDGVRRIDEKKDGGE